MKSERLPGLISEFLWSLTKSRWRFSI